MTHPTPKEVRAARPGPPDDFPTATDFWGFALLALVLALEVFACYGGTAP